MRTSSVDLAQPFTSPAGRLGTHALLHIVDRVAGAEPMWAHLVVHDPGERSTVRLIATASYEVWLLGWTPGQHVELHDHGPSHAAFHVAEGTLVELEPGPRGLVRRTLRAGSRRVVPSGTVHDVLNDSLAPATSVHAYSPPLSAMTFYDPSATRAVRSERVARVAPVLDDLVSWPVAAVRQLARR